jgi:hypothetical protein
MSKRRAVIEDLQRLPPRSLLLIVDFARIQNRALAVLPHGGNNRQQQNAEIRRSERE